MFLTTIKYLRLYICGGMRQEKEHAGSRKGTGESRGLHAQAYTDAVQVREVPADNGGQCGYADPYLEGLQGSIPVAGKDICGEVGMDNDLKVYLREDGYKEESAARHPILHKRRTATVGGKVCATRVALFAQQYPGRDVL